MEERREENLTHNPGAHGGVSNCVIKYVTGSLDATVEAWSRYRAEVRDAGRKKNNNQKTKTNKTKKKEEVKLTQNTAPTSA